MKVAFGMTAKTLKSLEDRRQAMAVRALIFKNITAQLAALRSHGDVDGFRN